MQIVIFPHYANHKACYPAALLDEHLGFWDMFYKVTLHVFFRIIQIYCDYPMKFWGKQLTKIIFYTVFRESLERFVSCIRQQIFRDITKFCLRRYKQRQQLDVKTTITGYSLSVALTSIFGNSRVNGFRCRAPWYWEVWLSHPSGPSYDSWLPIVLIHLQLSHAWKSTNVKPTNGWFRPCSQQ